MESYLSKYFRCPEDAVQIVSEVAQSSSNGYFRFGRGAMLFGRLSGKGGSARPTVEMPDVATNVVLDQGKIRLPFDLDETVDNLYRETYADAWRNGPVSILSI